MEQSVLFYCLVCNKLKTMEQANLLFRTGFYKVQHPLGFCVSCEHQTK